MRKNGRETPFGLCLVNAAFIMGGSSAMSLAALNIVLKVSPAPIFPLWCRS